ncbi:MAG: hypothetical protein U5K79_17215 [Cyclobacteriaceae bacterium]|nr:hypothetical protein [Cyclobacteriaceae bacterium]
MQQQESVEDMERSDDDVSHARACRLVGLSRTQKYYKKKMPSKDKELSGIIRGAPGSSLQGRDEVILKVQRRH